MQNLNKFAYRVLVSRIQTKLTVCRVKVRLLTRSSRFYKHHIFAYDGLTHSEIVDEHIFDFSNLYTVQVMCDLYGFKDGARTPSFYQYANIFDKSKR